MNIDEFYTSLDKNSLSHHGIMGQKWGVRRYQNPDGSLTEEGRRRYGISGERLHNAQNRSQAIRTAKDSYRNRVEEIKNTATNKQSYKSQMAKEKNSYKNERLRIKAQSQQDRSAAQKTWKEARHEYLKNNETLGKTIAKALILSPLGAYTYNSLRTSGAERLEAATIAYASSLLGMYGSVPVSIYVAEKTKANY